MDKNESDNLTESLDSSNIPPDADSQKEEYSSTPASISNNAEPEAPASDPATGKSLADTVGEDITPPDEKERNGQAVSSKESTEKYEEGTDATAMGLLDHLAELRSRLVKATIGVALGFAVCWVFIDPIFDVLSKPLLAVLPEGTHAQYTTLPEAFFTRMQIAFVGGLFVASPIIFYQIWAFVAPGLYDNEKRYIIPIAILSALFFTGGAVFCYFIVFPFAFNFFISYSTPEIVVTPKMSDYINFVLKLIFAFGLIFEMPIFTLFLARMGIITAKLMRKGQKYAVVAIFIIAAILTPPDVVSQLLMACPMLALYELSIGVAAVFGKKTREEASE